MSKTTLYGGAAHRRVTILDLANAKARGEKWPMLTAYEQLTAEIFDEAGIPVLLVGDSAGNNFLGFENTIPVTVDELIPLARAVVTASQKALKLAGLTLDQMDLVELNEAFAAQALSVMRGLGLADDAAHVNPNGGAIALGHPLGASGARLVLTALRHLENTNGRYALCTMCIGVGQGIAMVIERLEA